MVFPGEIPVDLRRLQLALRSAKGVLCQLFQLRNQFLAGDACEKTR